MRAYTKHIALLLLAVISAFIVPKELVHAFYGHEDTVHEIINDSDLPVIDHQHQHCSILDFNVPLYFHSLTFFSAGEKAFPEYISENAASFVSSASFRLFSLRGPPAC